jgi:hypothetical protein
MCSGDVFLQNVVSVYLCQENPKPLIRHYREKEILMDHMWRSYRVLIHFRINIRQLGFSWHNTASRIRRPHPLNARNTSCWSIIGMADTHNLLALFMTSYLLVGALEYSCFTEHHITKIPCLGQRVLGPEKAIRDMRRTLSRSWTNQ